MATRVLSPSSALLTIPLTLALLEPDAVKVARPVLRGEGSGNAPDLPDPLRVLVGKP